MDGNLTRVTCLNIIVDQVHPFIEMVFPDGLFQQDNVHTLFREQFEEPLKTLLIKS